MVRARILGIGVNPSIPNEFTHNVQNCDAVRTELTKCEAKRGFSVHSYRVQRRRVIGADFPLLSFNVVINFIYVIGKIFICIFGLLATTLKVLSTPSTQQYDEFVNATKLKVYRKLKQEDTITNKINRINSISIYTTNYNWKWNSKNKEEVSLFSFKIM